MGNDAHSEGFLSRWSRRKTDERAGRALDAPSSPAAPATMSAPACPPSTTATVPSDAQSPTPLPTLADVEQLTSASDFSAFVARDVPSDVKSAAMKKLFADPHFNVMDGMDVYIDDYTQPDPLPMAMLRQMASAHAMDLWREVAQPPSSESQGAPEVTKPGSETLE